MVETRRRDERRPVMTHSGRGAAPVPPRAPPPKMNSRRRAFASRRAASATTSFAARGRGVAGKGAGAGGAAASSWAIGTRICFDRGRAAPNSESARSTSA